MDKPKPGPARIALRRVVGWLWALLWLWALRRLTAPWENLGGIVSEPLRWLARVVLWSGLIVGFTVGSWTRVPTHAGTGLTHMQLLRRCWWPVASVAAAGLIALRWTGCDDSIGVVVAGFFAYWAGLDVGFAAWPLMHARPYRFDRPIDGDLPHDERPPFGGVPAVGTRRRFPP